MTIFWLNTLNFEYFHWHFRSVKIHKKLKNKSNLSNEVIQIDLPTKLTAKHSRQNSPAIISTLNSTPEPSTNSTLYISSKITKTNYAHTDDAAYSHSTVLLCQTSERYMHISRITFTILHTGWFPIHLSTQSSTKHRHTLCATEPTIRASMQTNFTDYFTINHQVFVSASYRFVRLSSLPLIELAQEYVRAKNVVLVIGGTYFGWKNFIPNCENP